MIKYCLRQNTSSDFVRNTFYSVYLLDGKKARYTMQLGKIKHNQYAYKYYHYTNGLSLINKTRTEFRDTFYMGSKYYQYK